MASLGLVSPLFSPKNLATFFSHRYTRWWPFWAVVSSQLHNSHLSISCCPVFFVNSATQFFSLGCHPLDGVTRAVRLSAPWWCHWKAAGSVSCYSFPLLSLLNPLCKRMRIRFFQKLSPPLLLGKPTYALVWNVVSQVLNLYVPIDKRMMMIMMMMVMTVVVDVCLTDDGQEIKVPVLLNGTESIMEFIDLPYSGVRTGYCSPIT